MKTQANLPQPYENRRLCSIFESRFRVVATGNSSRFLIVGRLITYNQPSSMPAVAGSRTVNPLALLKTGISRNQEWRYAVSEVEI
jgi:hypothetical protein